MVAGAWTLDEALNFGQGIERPFRCPSHDDTNASASVNVLKGVWYCYACNAAGTADGKKAPTAAQLAAMLEPEAVVRTYPESWLDLFRDHGYWAKRFPDWLCWHLQMGIDPFTGDAVFPVHTPQGVLAGVGRRLHEPGPDDPRYKYPPRWSASRTLGGIRIANADKVGMLVEGYADMTAGRELGIDTFCVFGSGMHLPQRELVMRMNKKLWLLGFDMDEAGEKAAERAKADLVELVEVARVEWPQKDPADTPMGPRAAAVHRAVETVRPTVYGSLDALIKGWSDRQQHTIGEYEQYLQEVA